MSEKELNDEESGLESPRCSHVAQPGRMLETAGWDIDILAMIEEKHREVMERMDQQCLKLDLIMKGKKPQEDRRPSTASTAAKEPLVAKTASAADGSGKRRLQVSAASSRPSFTPQLFKTFSQNDLNKRKQAQAASVRRSASMESQVEVEMEPQPRWSLKIVRHPAFDLFFTVVVITNSIFLGVELQLFVNQPTETYLSVQIVQYLYTALFTGELLMRVAADRRIFCGDECIWALLDLFIVLFSLWEAVVDLVLCVLEKQGQSGVFSGFSSLKAFRIIRITRLVKAVRLVRILRFVMAFRMLITSIIHTLKSLFWATMLLVLIIYVFAVLFTQAVHDHLLDPEVQLSPEVAEASRVYFGDLAETMLSLFMSISGGVSWENVIYPLKAMSNMWVVVYLFYVAFTVFAVLNVVTAVFCQSAIDGAQNDHASKVHAILANKEAHLQKIQTLFSKFGVDSQGGVITFEMFQQKIKAAEVREYFQTLGLDVWDAWSFFKLLDEDGGGEVEIEEFLMGCLRLRGQATAMDVGKIINDQTWLIRSQGKFQAYVEVELKQLKDQLGMLTGVAADSDEHIGLIFGEPVKKTGSRDSRASRGIKEVHDYPFDRRISP